MNVALLPILARLHSLQMVSRVGADGGRVVASRTDPNPITVVLREINETILGRTLHFTSESGATLSIEVVGRRILRVIRADGLPDAEVCLAAAVLDDELKDDLIKLLLAFAVPRQEIRVTPVVLLHNPSGLSVGLPVALIADLLLAELNGLDAELSHEATPPFPVMASTAASSSQQTGSGLGQIVRANNSALMAWLILGGEEDGQSEGPEEMLDHLKAFLQDEIGDLHAQLDRISSSSGGPVCLALGASLVEGHSLVCARLNDGILLGLAEGDCTPALTAGWSAARS